MANAKAKAAPKNPGFSLFQLTQDDGIQHELLEKALALAESAGLGQEEAMAQALASVDKLTERKVISYATRIMQLDAEALALAADAKRQAARASARSNFADALRKRLIELCPKDAVYEDTRAKVSFRDYPVLDVPNVAALPKEHQEEIPASVKVADHVALKKAVFHAKDLFDAKVKELVEGGMSEPDAIKEASPLLFQGAAIKENWKVVIK